MHGVHVGVDHARRNAVDPDIARAKLLRERLAQADNRSLARGIMALAGRAALPPHGRHRNDASLVIVQHFRQHSADGAYRTHEIDIQHAHPVRVGDILEQLFWLDEEQPGVIKLVPTERGTARYNANPNLALHYDDNDNWPPRSPVAMWFDDTILDDFLKDWAAVQKKLYAGEITQAEYFEWKIMWPSTL